MRLTEAEYMMLGMMITETNDRLNELLGIEGSNEITAMLQTQYTLLRKVRSQLVAWHPMETAPRDGRNILIRFGQDGVSQAKYIPGLPHPWQFIDTQDGISWLSNHAVDTQYGPTHWMPMPDVSVNASMPPKTEIRPSAKAENSF